jgi:hypothetical protein
LALLSATLLNEFGPIINVLVAVIAGYLGIIIGQRGLRGDGL